MELVDTSRNDTYAPKPESRRIMVSSYYPANSLKNCQPVMLPYMPPATAAVYDQMYAPIGIPNGTFGSFELSTCAFNRKDRSRGPNDFPIVLFSPGLGNSRLLYGAMAQSLASHGYVVITMDHAYDANIVEYPDKSIALAVDIETTEQITADVVLLLSTSTTLFGDVLNEGLSSPFMIMSHAGKSLTTDPSWTQVWPRVTGTKLAVTLNGTVHGSYSDLPLLANTLGLSAKASPQVGELLGMMDGVMATENVNAFAGQFFKFAGGLTTDLLPRDIAKKFPEARVLDKYVRK
ncbi:PAF acetylhydrolase family protein, partial [Aureobasidium melanogenum]